MIKDRLLRPSLVAVSKKSSNKNEDQEKDKKDQQNHQKSEKKLILMGTCRLKINTYMKRTF